MCPIKFSYSQEKNGVSVDFIPDLKRILIVGLNEFEKKEVKIFYLIRH